MADCFEGWAGFARFVLRNVSACRLDRTLNARRSGPDSAGPYGSRTFVRKPANSTNWVDCRCRCPPHLDEKPAFLSPGGIIILAAPLLGLRLFCRTASIVPWLLYACTAKSA